MTRAEIFTAIDAERARQNEKHPVAFNSILDEEYDPCALVLEMQCATVKEQNEHRQKWGRESAYLNAREEFLEFFAETDKSSQLEEAIQNAALWVRIIEEITK